MGPKNKYSLPYQKKEEIQDIIKIYLHSSKPVIFAFVHGSFLEEGLSFRDIDIAIFFDQENLHNDMMELCLEMSAQLSLQVHLPVDVHALNDSSIGFRYEVSRGRLLLTRDEEKSFDFMEKTWAKYFDLKPLLEENLKDLLLC